MTDQLPYQDITLKARLADPQQTEKILEGIGATRVGVDLQKDIYFKTAKGKLKWRQGNIENLITHYERISEKGVETTVVYRYDLNPTRDQIEELMANHKSIGTVEKERTIYTLRNLKIYFDKMKGGEAFLEIEAIDREGVQSRDSLHQQCLEIKTKLEIRDTDLIKTGYFKQLVRE